MSRKFVSCLYCGAGFLSMICLTALAEILWTNAMAWTIAVPLFLSGALFFYLLCRVGYSMLTAGGAISRPMPVVVHPIAPERRREIWS
jgi:hypothetical protein